MEQAGSVSVSTHVIVGPRCSDRMSSLDFEFEIAE